MRKSEGHRAALSVAMTKHGHSRREGGKPSPEYVVWMAMRGRCHRPEYRGYERYGGRGISVCERWRKSFDLFLADMGPRPSLQHQIDRIDGAGNYEPGNCRWATREEQGQNKSTNVRIAFGGRTLCLAEWAREISVNEKTLRWRLNNGWSVERALTTRKRAA